MPYFRSIAIAITLLVSSASINAQTQIGIANCSISGSDFSASGTCAITPFGPMMVSAGLAIMSKSQTANLQFTFSSGTGTFSASALNQAYTVGMNSVAIQGNANITAGTGMFADASGSFTFNFMGMGPANNETATLAGSGTINVQISLSATLPGAMVGVPYSNNVRQGLSLIPSGAQFGLSAGSSLPPGLTLSASGLLSGTPTETGNYSISVTVTGTTESGTLQLSLTVTANPSPAVTVTPGALNFSLTEGSTSHSVTESIVITNERGPQWIERRHLFGNHIDQDLAGQPTIRCCSACYLKRRTSPGADLAVRFSIRDRRRRKQPTLAIPQHHQ
jgi:hypothetical protein